MLRKFDFLLKNCHRLLKKYITRQSYSKCSNMGTAHFDVKFEVIWCTFLHTKTFFAKNIFKVRSIFNKIIRDKKKLLKKLHLKNFKSVV